MNEAHFDVSLFEQKGVEAVVAGMMVVRAYQLHDKIIGETIIKKEDESFLSVADRECGEVLHANLRLHFLDIRSNIEDLGESHDNSKVTIYGDPIDGTIPFTVGLSTSTIILGAYDTETKQVLACVVGEPASGRLWYTRGGQSYRAKWDFTTKQLKDEHQVIVWSGKLSHNTVVFLDNSQGFKRSGRQILTHKQVERLLVKLAKYRLLLAGSNGLHQAILAQGNANMAGAITSAMGGPQDVCGVRLVLDAGGVARAFFVDGRKLVEQSPHAIEDYDILIVGNNQATANELLEVLYSSIK